MSLDELLRYPEEEPASHRVASARLWYHWLVKPLSIALVCAGIGWLMLRVSELAVPYPLLVMIFLVAQLLLKTVAFIGVRPVPPALLRGPANGTALPASLPDPANGAVLLRAAAPFADSSDDEADGLSRATARWDTRLSWVRLQHDPQQFARTVQPRLVGLVDERLRLRHGIDRARQPEPARAILGEPLWTFMTTPVRHTMTPNELAALIGRMEAL